MRSGTSVFKGTVHPFTHPHVISNQFDLGYLLTRTQKGRLGIVFVT